MLKNKILDELFSLNGNHYIDKIKEIKDELSDYLVANSDDVQIRDGLRMLEAFSAENINNDSDTSRELVAPIFERLAHADKWDIYDIKLISSVLGGASTADQAHTFAQKALSELEEYSDERGHTNIKLSIYMNTQYRLLRAKYFDSDNLIPSDELTKRFHTYYRAIIDMCEGSRGKLDVYKFVAFIRRGFFYAEEEMQRQGFSLLEECIGDTDEIYRMMEADAEEFKTFTELNLSRQQVEKIISKNIKRKRLEVGYTIHDLAALSGLAESLIEMLESGNTVLSSLSSFSTYKLSKALEVPVDAFYEGLGTNFAHNAKSIKRKAQLKRLEMLAGDLTTKELEYIVAMAEALPDARG